MRQSVGLAERDGLLVRRVAEGGPADRAGVREGDLLVRAGDRDLATADDLYAVLAGHDPATALGLGVVRGVDEVSVTVEF
jgi:S1-C subfamily serine protease